MSQPGWSDDRVTTLKSLWLDGLSASQIATTTTTAAAPRAMTDMLVNRSFATLKWMRTKGVRFQPSYGRQAFKVDGKFKFWGGLACHILGGGQHLGPEPHDVPHRRVRLRVGTERSHLNEVL